MQMHSIVDKIAIINIRMFANKVAHLLISLLIVGAFSGCGTVQELVLGTGPEQTDTPTPRPLLPTFTPTPEATATPDLPTNTDTPVPPTEPPEATATETPPPAPRLIVSSPANIRNGPGTTYGIIGASNPGDEYDVVGKSSDNAWWQICCVAGQEGWIFGQLVQAENAAEVQVAQNIAPPPAPPTQPPPPTAAPAPPPAEADPCVGIGGDGCKFKVRDGPKFGNNGGQEIKLMLFFVHGGRNNEPQGSYFVVMEKNGTRLPIGDGTRSIAKDERSGPLGPYNYEYKINISQLPDGNVGGNYTMWVLDGNGERDSRNISFTIPEGQGEVWIMWDQS